MQPNCYVDIRIDTLKPAARPLAAAGVMRRLHGVFRDLPGRFALALPDHARSVFTRIRVFATDADDLDLLIGMLRPEDEPLPHAKIGEPCAVPERFEGPWLTFARYRIPTRKQERKPDGTVRLRRIVQAQERDLPFFPMASLSTGQRFRLYVAVEPADSTLPECEPDTYGLSVASRRFAVPALP